MPQTKLDFVDTKALGKLLNATEVDWQALRKTLTSANQSLVQQYKKNVPASALISKRALLIDFVLNALWQRVIQEDAPVALLAVGGYGRGALQPFSDVDILILQQDSANPDEDEPLSSFITSLWNTGIKIGHGVQTLKACNTSLDHRILTSLLEARFLCGDKNLYRMMEHNLQKQMSASTDFFIAKQKELQQRYKKYNNTAYNLEPDIKNGPGGLRDIHVINWIARCYFGTHSLQDLVTQNILTEAEYLTLIECQNTLWQIRYCLHTLSGRSENRLLFDYQGQIATALGFKKKKKVQSIEQFMKRYYQTVKTLSEINETVMQLFEEKVLHAETAAQVTPINKHFNLVNGYINAVSEDTFIQHPSALLEIFLFACKQGAKGISGQSMRLLRESRYLIDKDFRDNVYNQQLFLKIIRQGQDVPSILWQMNRFGLLGKYIPEFAHSIGLMQYDLFHAYTVDQHLLFVVRNLSRYQQQKVKDTFPLCCELMSAIDKPEVLYLAALFHDIGKGLDGDHSTIGAKYAFDFCTGHHFSIEDATLVSWLVQNHLLLSMTAQRKDIYDETVVREFASEVKTLERLQFLYILTVADVCATNNTLWNSFKDALFKHLYHAGLAFLQDKAEKHKTQITQNRQQALETLSTHFPVERVSAWWDELDEAYFRRESVDSIIWQTRIILERTSHEPTIALRDEQDSGCTELLVYMPDDPHIFANTTAILDQAQTTIMESRIRTTKQGNALHHYFVLSHNDALLSSDEQYSLAAKLRHQLRAGTSIAPIKKKRPSRFLRHFDLDLKLQFKQQGSRTLLFLSCLDSPGLLAKLGRVFLETGTHLHQAKITTLGERVEDTFFLSNGEFAPLTEAEEKVLSAAISKKI